MKRLSFQGSVLGGLGLACLLASILACVSFSPDDSKVLYPAFDSKATNFVICLYDRKTRQSQQVFAPPVLKGDSKAEYLRPQWLADGKSFLVAWEGPQTNRGPEGLNIAVQPLGARGPAKSFFLADADGGLLMYPLAMAGAFVFFPSKSNELIRLNLTTGETTNHPVKGDVLFLPALRNLIYLEKTNESAAELRVGTLDPETFQQTEVMRFKTPESEAYIAVGLEGKLLAFLPDADKTNNTDLVVARLGKPELKLALGAFSPPNFLYGNGVFSSKGDRLYAAFEHVEKATNVSYGFLEIPMDGSPIRQTLLIPKATLKSGQDKGNVSFFQIGLSHDGQTLGVASSYLVAGEDVLLEPENRALFLVDLSDSNRKVTKVLATPEPQK